MKILFVLKSQGFFYYILFLLICTQLEYLYFAGLTGKCQEGYKRPRFPFNINTQPAPFILSEKTCSQFIYSCICRIFEQLF